MAIPFKKITLIFYAVFISIIGFAHSQHQVRLASPDGRILFEFEIRNGRPGYRVLFEGKLLIDFSVMNLIFQGDSLTQGVKLEKSVILDSTERYLLITGRSSRVSDVYRQLTLNLIELGNTKRKINVQVRAFNDGLAFRYLFP